MPSKVYYHLVDYGRLTPAVVYKCGDEEHCCICKQFILEYDFDESEERLLFIDDKYFGSFPDDVWIGNKLYHTCGPQCRQVLELAPDMDIPDADISSL